MPYNFKKATKRTRKVVKKALISARRTVQNRYIYPKSGYIPNVNNIVKDVEMLKGMINAEKKRLTVSSVSSLQYGQVMANTSGHFGLDLTPLVAEGVTYSTRSGSSLKWASTWFEMQLSQVSSVSPIKYEIHLVKVIGTVFSSVTTALSQYMVPNKFLQLQNPGAPPDIYDVTASRNQDYYKVFRTLRVIKGLVPQDTLANQTTMKTFAFGHKFNSHIRYSLDTSVPTQGQVLMFIFFDNGNKDSTTASTLVGVPITAVNTGVNVNYNFTHYYLDN